jgi:transcriptional regulator with XRE-family HTH domain
MPAVNFTLLRDRRDELEISNDELAVAIGRSKKYIENVLCGSDAPSMRVVHGFARVLKMNFQIILAKPTGDPSDPPKQPDRPTGPAKRQTTERTKGPRRAAEDAA